MGTPIRSLGEIAQIEVIKRLLAATFPGNGKDGVDWRALKRELEPLEWTEEWGKTYPMLVKWSKRALGKLERHLRKLKLKDPSQNSDERIRVDAQQPQREEA